MHNTFSASKNATKYENLFQYTAVDGERGVTVGSVFLLV